MGWGYSIMQPMVAFMNPYGYRLFGELQHQGNSFVISAYDVGFEAYSIICYTVEDDPSNYRNATIIFN